MMDCAAAADAVASTTASTKSPRHAFLIIERCISPRCRRTSAGGYFGGCTIGADNAETRKLLKLLQKRWESNPSGSVWGTGFVGAFTGLCLRAACRYRHRKHLTLNRIDMYGGSIGRPDQESGLMGTMQSRQLRGGGL